MINSCPPATCSGRGRFDERGLSESVQWAILGVAFMGCLLALIEAGLWLHGRSVVVAAALAGASAASAWQAAPDSGERAARETASAGGLTGVQVTVTTQSGAVLVIVEADTPGFAGWVAPHVRAQAIRPREQR
ncbi:MAG: pilus assembly protein [Micrococcales bacterium]|nr:pilus assembly protein [Micrococcales bacterium]